MNRRALTLVECLLVAAAFAPSAPGAITGLSLGTPSETVFFFDAGSTLIQAFEVAYTNDTGGAIAAAVVSRIEGSAETFSTNVLFGAGTGFARLSGLARWPDPATGITFTVTAPQGTEIAVGTAGDRRPWTVYLVQDKHLDYAWNVRLSDMTATMNDWTDYYLGLTAETLAPGSGDGPEEQNRFAFDQSIWFDEYERHGSASGFSNLVSAVQSGHVEVGGHYTVLLHGVLGHEELVRSFYFARRVERVHGGSLRTGVPMENGAMPWGLASVAAGCGIDLLVKGICLCAYPDSYSHVTDREPYALFRWEGPDGSQTLVKWDRLLDGNSQSYGGYAELRVLYGKTRDAQWAEILSAIDRYEALPGYPVDAILLYGMGWDDYLKTRDVLEFVRWANSQGWTYPRMVNAAPGMFADHVEDSLARTGASLPVLRGDYGNAWEIWPRRLSILTARMRRTREALMTAEKLAALAAAAGDPQAADYSARIDTAYRDIMKFYEHSWEGTFQEATSELLAGKQAWTAEAGGLAASTIQDALAFVGGILHAPYAQSIFVFNPVSWTRSGVVRIPDPGSTLQRVRDPRTGEMLPAQRDGAELVVEIPDLPPLGYLQVAGGGDAASFDDIPVADAAGGWLSNRWWTVKCRAADGAVTSLVSRATAREFIAGAAGELEIGVVPGSVATTVPAAGPVYAALSFDGELPGGRPFHREVRLYRADSRIDIVTRFEHPTGFQETGWIRFPLAFDGADVHYEGAGAVLRPGLLDDGGDHQPGSYETVGRSVQHFVDVSDGGAGMTVSPFDTYWLDMDLSGGTTLLRFNVHANDGAGGFGYQGWETEFNLEFCLFPYEGGYDGLRAVEQSWGCQQPPIAMLVEGPTVGSLPPGPLSLVEPVGPGVVLTTLKTAEEGPARGWVARVWNVSGAADPSFRVAWPLAESPVVTDLLERDRAPAVQDGEGRWRFDAAPLGFGAVRLVTRPLADDPDRDGMPTTWENEQRFDPFDDTDGDEDADGDRQSNSAEYTAATDPRDRADFLRIVEVDAAEADQILLRWEGRVGVAYYVERSDCVCVTWEPVDGPLTVEASSTIDWVGASTAVSPSFLRVRAKRQEHEE